MIPRKLRPAPVRVSVRPRLRTREIVFCSVLIGAILGYAAGIAQAIWTMGG